MNQNELAAIHLPMKDSFDKSSFVDAFFVNTAVREKEGERERERERVRERECVSERERERGSLMATYSIAINPTTCNQYGKAI